MTDRERFESFCCDVYGVPVLAEDRNGDGYRDTILMSGWSAWQASRTQVLEQVMEKLVAEKQYGGGWIDDADAVDVYRIGAEACANIVGDFLANPEGEQG